MVISRVMSLYHHNHQGLCQRLCELRLYHQLHLHQQDVHLPSVGQHCSDQVTKLSKVHLSLHCGSLTS